MAGKKPDATLVVLREIRDELKKTNTRLDQTNMRLDHTNERLDSMDGRLGALERYLPEMEIRFSTAMVGYVGAVNAARDHDQKWRGEIEKRLAELERKTG